MGCRFLWTAPEGARFSGRATIIYGDYDEPKRTPISRCLRSSSSPFPTFQRAGSVRQVIPPVQEAARTYYSAVDAATERQAKALEEGVPTARVVRVRGAHYIFLSNESETLRETRAFLAGLK